MRLLPLFVLSAFASAAAADSEPSFSKQIGPLLQEHCLRCHSGTRPKGDLNLTSAAGLRQGGAHGSVVTPGKAAASPLFTHVRDKKMPPKEPLDAAQAELLRRWIDAGAKWEGPALSVSQKQEERRAGADWWSLQPINRPPLPTVIRPTWQHNPVDAFILANLERARLSPSPHTDRRTYIRRVSVDLIGLLPSPEEIDAFVNDAAPDAYEKLVDRLLASPHYGERWGRHWLDVVRFAESHGYEMNTLRPNAWPYRDYVIRALNEDRPFAQFVREQVAGDAVANGDPVVEAATGFLVGGTHDMVGNATVEGKLQQRVDDLYDMVSTTGSAFLGLTINCARCHDHKFDPISQRDYYSMQAIFSGVQHAERPIAMTDPEKRRQEVAELRTRLAQLDQRLDALVHAAGEPGSPVQREPVNPRRNVERFSATEARFVRVTITATNDGLEPCLDELEIWTSDAAPRNVALASVGARTSASSVFPNSTIHRLEHLNDGKYGNSRSWISNERGQGWVQVELPEAARIDRILWGRDREQRYRDRLATDYRIEVSQDGKTWRAVAGSWDRLSWRLPARTGTSAERQALLDEQKQLDSRLALLEKPEMVYAGTFQKPEPAYLLKRGDPLQKGEEVAPAAIQKVGPPLVLDPKAPERERRLALAAWISDPKNPLPARVLVNRLWHYHFGQGIVRTPSDFGFNGDRPSHPELLDWLASEFQANGGRQKPLHRLIVLSQTYRQASQPRPDAQRADADSRLLWRMLPRRLEAEALRDALLQVSGSLNRRMGGPGYHLWDYSGYVIVFTPRAQLGADEFRRMVYQFKPRTQQDETFGAFDCPDATQIMPRRNVSTTALQALNLLNGDFVADQARRFAERLRHDAGSEVRGQARRAFLLAFGREPSATEADAAAALIQKHGAVALCRALLNANEFVYVD